MKPIKWRIPGIVLGGCLALHAAGTGPVLAQDAVDPEQLKEKMKDVQPPSELKQPRQQIEKRPDNPEKTPKKGKLPDLDLTGGVGSLANLRPGQNIGTDLYAEVENAGTGTAPGTIGSLDPANGYMVDFVLSTDPWPPIRIARYSERFHDGVLLKGGRSSRTVDLAPGDAKTYSDSTAVMPIAIKPGNYFLCAVVDPHDRVRELNEHNNTQCVEISVKGP